MAMVSEAKVNGGEAEAPTELPPALAEKPAGLPPGKYSLVGWDMDTTGRRLIDEICQIAAYTPKQQYSQYIMPYGDLNPGARRRHNVRVVTVGRYRMLKDTNTHKILKTKSEISALTDFLDWLEKEKGDGSVILIYHEPRRLSPTMLLEALTRYKLLDRFKSIVAGFTDSYALAADKCKATVKSVSLRVLARVLLDADSLAVDSALDRAAAAYRIVEHLAQGKDKSIDCLGDKCKATVKSVSLRVLARVLLDADSLAVDSALDRAAAAYRIVEHLAQGKDKSIDCLGDKCKATVKSVSLRVLARVLLDADSLAVDSALDRAAAAYRIVEHLAQGKDKSIDCLGDKCKATVKSVSLRVLARVLLDADSLAVDSALDRAAAAYRIVEHLAQGKDKSIDCLGDKCKATVKSVSLRVLARVLLDADSLAVDSALDRAAAAYRIVEHLAQGKDKSIDCLGDKCKATVKSVSLRVLARVLLDADSLAVDSALDRAAAAYRIVEHLAQGKDKSIDCLGDKCKATVKSVSLRVLARVLLDADSLAVDSALDRAAAAYRIVEHLAQGKDKSIDCLADKCKATVKSVSLRVLARVLLDADSLAVDSALDRAAAAYRIVEHLAQGKDKSIDCLGDKCKATVKSVSLRVLARVLLDADSLAVDSALDRAAAAYRIVEHLAQGKDKSIDCLADKCKATVKSVSLRVLARVLLDADSLAVDSALDRAAAAYRIVEHLAQGKDKSIDCLGDKCKATVKSVSLRVLARVLLDADSLAVDSALDRAAAAYRIVEHLAQGKDKSIDCLGDKCKATVKSVSLRVLARVLLDADSLAVDSALDRAAAAYRIVEHLAQGKDKSIDCLGDKCKATVKSVSLRVLARVLLDADSLAVDSALDRAAAAYRIVEHLAQGEQQEVGAGGEGTLRDMVETARAWARPVHTELAALASLKLLLERQNTFRPVFAPLLRSARPERKRVTQLRRLLADAGLLYADLSTAWTDDKLAGLEKQMAALAVTAKEEDIKELIEIFDCHFDPAKEPKGPKPRTPRNRVRGASAGEAGSGSAEAEAEAEGSTSDSQHSSPHNSPSKTNNDVSAGDSSRQPEAVAAN
ncbi:uncharacterized protein LOC133516532 [Cydia pomonella]|uniref:uncharacterized protein LOC133516532 n=1 Tax=Cydia pomonella TaxID=82600 RepID=UPI002ADDFBCE|nr:uncharacterized protein LOC133516532 [Cydia pomonella]